MSPVTIYRLAEQFGPWLARCGKHRCVNGFKVFIWILSLSGLALVYGSVFSLIGMEGLRSGKGLFFFGLFPILCVGVPLYLYGNPWEKDWVAYIFEEYLVINKNGDIEHLKYSDIREIKDFPREIAHVLVHQPLIGINIDNELGFFMLPQMGTDHFDLLSEKVASSKTSLPAPQGPSTPQGLSKGFRVLIWMTSLCVLTGLVGLLFWLLGLERALLSDEGVSFEGLFVLALKILFVAVPWFLFAKFLFGNRWEKEKD